MVKSGMVMLAEREKTDVTDVNVIVGWTLQPIARAMVGERERELTWRERE
jgi:hypothetical protein